jgi:DNA-binding FadR family transcriptional regulator
MVEARDLHDSVVESWGTEIVTGATPPGSRIVAEEAAARWGVSRSVVREAARVLESMGMVETRRKVGITVREPQHWNPFDPHVIRWRLAGPDRRAQLEQLSELRSAIEPLAARLAASRATPEQCGALTAGVVGMASTARSANTDAYLDHDASFHRALLEASGNPMLAGLADVVAEVLAGRTRHELMPAQADPDAVRLHGEVAAAIQRGDPDDAEAAMRGIVDESTTAMHEALAPPTVE